MVVVQAVIDFDTARGRITCGQRFQAPMPLLPKLAGKVKLVDPHKANIPYCYNCHGIDFWHSVHGPVVCRRCHPPAPGAERRSK